MYLKKKTQNKSNRVVNCYSCLIRYQILPLGQFFFPRRQKAHASTPQLAPETDTHARVRVDTQLENTVCS